MAEHTQTESKGVPAIVNFVAGLLLIVAGSTFLSHAEVPIPGLSLNLGKTVSMLGVLLVMFPIIKQFYVQPLEEAIHDRNSNLEQTFAEAESLKERMQALKSSYEEKLAAAEADARAQIQSAINEANQMKAKILDDAKVQADEIRQRGAEEMEREKQKMLVDLRTHVVDLTLNATEKIIGQSMDEQKQRELIGRFIENAEVGR